MFWRACRRDSPAAGFHEMLYQTQSQAIAMNLSLYCRPSSVKRIEYICNLPRGNPDASVSNGNLDFTPRSIDRCYITSYPPINTCVLDCVAEQVLDGTLEGVRVSLDHRKRASDALLDLELAFRNHQTTRSQGSFYDIRDIHGPGRQSLSSGLDAGELEHLLHHPGKSFPLDLDQLSVGFNLCSVVNHPISEVFARGAYH